MEAENCLQNQIDSLNLTVYNYLKKNLCEIKRPVRDMTGLSGFGESAIFHKGK